MLGLNTLRNAVNALARNLEDLAATVSEVNRGVRGRLALDDDAPAAMPPAIESRLAALPEPPHEAEGGPEANGKGRKRKAAAE